MGAGEYLGNGGGDSRSRTLNPSYVELRADVALVANTLTITPGLEPIRKIVLRQPNGREKVVYDALTEMTQPAPATLTVDAGSAKTITLPTARTVQVGGDHYRKMKIQPITYILANAIPFCEGSIIKYVSRWRSKGGVQDLKKARHLLDLMIEEEERASNA